VSTSVRIGGLAPLSRPGFLEAGRQLKAGLELGVADVNGAGGVDGHPVELMLRDTAGDPDQATEALHELNTAEVVAVVGEFHSVVAKQLAGLAHDLALPFVCASAVLDALTEQPTGHVARLAPAQSYCWSIYSEYLLNEGYDHAFLAVEPTEYWSSGAAVIEGRFQSSQAACTRIDAASVTVSELVDLLRSSTGEVALLLLVGYPEPAVTIVRAVRSDPRLDDVLIGDPAGRAECAEWSKLLGHQGLGVPYLRYLPERLDDKAVSVASRLEERLHEPPSFVALEAYDAVEVVAGGLRLGGRDRSGLSEALARVEVPGTRGLIRFSRAPGVSVLQWVWPPVQVAARMTAGVHATLLYQRRART
jgi:ABC-type branched-subunit amino acid transport system substrate-binding protein